MDFNTFLRRVQEWTNKIPLIIVGSGSSVPFGIPGMWQLGEHLKASVSLSEKEDSDQFEQFKILLDRYKDLEKLYKRYSQE